MKTPGHHRPLTSRILNATVIVAALGYFVDIYDLILFGIVRGPSLRALGYDGQELVDKGLFLLNMQMAGMLLGGLLWGILGDMKGRISVLYGSIFLYSIANILNAMVVSIDQYALLRFLAGVGLAGELGAGITLVNETMTKEQRGYGTMVVVTFGALGAVVAAMIADNFQWQTSYYVGGALGLALLLLRIGTYESGMFRKVQEKGTGLSFLKLFASRDRLYKYFLCILIGIPIWFVIGILVILSPELSKVIGVRGEVQAGITILWCYIGLSAGDFASGMISQLIKSRKKVVLYYIIGCTGVILLYLYSRDVSLWYFYFLSFVLGFSAGYWALFVTMASEQFGTNIRSTVTTTVPNFVRGSVIPVTISYQYLAGKFNNVDGAAVVGMICMLIAFLSLLPLKDTYGKDLDYMETI
ncbi:MAG: MFS transporter [Chitinophagales bacterium]|nr:MFS transporter [Chitinophagales bacterium]HAE14482.1 MFS transporter [Bacteroidota bacterium]MCB9020711.1 MFS transporter [Chitinophagales bacterium]MCB9031370.1 MFS transporter [Chitinophagales bacterium]HPE96744.1 MFS transporter [Chitinophagales bacterium]